MANSAGNFTYPRLKTFKYRAGYLKKNLPITHSQALEMIAFDYDCMTWGQLKKCIETSKTSPGHCGLYDRSDRLEAETLRKELASLSDWDECVSKLNDLTLIPNTISHSIAQKRLDWLQDDEIFSIHEIVFEGSESPKDPPTYSLYKAVTTRDNNILTHIHKVRTLKKKLNNIWIKDYRFGINYYVYIYLNGPQIKLVIRELDSNYTCYRPPINDRFSNNHCFNIFSTNWFTSYIEGFINNLITTLANEGFHGDLTLNHVNRISTVDYSSRDLASDDYSFSGMDILIGKLRQNGATVENLANQNDPGLSIAF